jgi:tRNA U34 2-thiouridine synthase MnmA/TrmU
VSVRDLTLHRHSRVVDGVRVRAHGRTFRCRLAGDLGSGRHEAARVQLEQSAERTAPGQLACLYAADVLVGHGTITR